MSYFFGFSWRYRGINNYLLSTFEIKEIVILWLTAYQDEKAFSTAYQDEKAFSTAYQTEKDDSGKDELYYFFLMGHHRNAGFTLLTVSS